MSGPDEVALRFAAAIGPSGDFVDRGRIRALADFFAGELGISTPIAEIDNAIIAAALRVLLGRCICPTPNIADGGCPVHGVPF